MKNNQEKGISIGEKLLRLRKEKNLSRKQAAKQIGITEYSLKAYEHNARFPRPEVKQRIARFYKTTIGSLFFNEE